MYIVLFESVYYSADIQNSLGEVKLIQGGVYTISIIKDDMKNATQVKTFKLTNENTVNILWQFPQHFLLAVGEVLLAITGLDFSYAQVRSFFNQFTIFLIFLKLSYFQKILSTYGPK